MRARRYAVRPALRGRTRARRLVRA
jgi:hypothetical protein